MPPASWSTPPRSPRSRRCSSPGSLNDVARDQPEDTQSGTLAAAFFADFVDVPQSIRSTATSRLFRSGITAGCGGGNYCRTRRHARADGGLPAEGRSTASAYVPPACTGPLRRRALPVDVRRLDRGARGRGHHGRLRRRQLLPGQPGHARADGGLPAEGEARTRRTCRRTAPASSATSPVRRLFADWIEQLAARAHHGRLRRRALLPATTPTPRADGGVPGEEVRVGRAVRRRTGETRDVRREAWTSGVRRPFAFTPSS